jgi:hypothetical protein
MYLAEADACGRDLLIRRLHESGKRNSSQEISEVQTGNLTIGGRPPIEGGHGPMRFTLNAETRKCLAKLKEGGGTQSQFIERVLVGPCRALDDEPRPGCKDIADIKKNVDDKLGSAIQNKDYNMIHVLSSIEQEIQPYVDLCEFKPSVSAPDKKQAENGS